MSKSMQLKQLHLAIVIAILFALVAPVFSAPAGTAAAQAADAAGPVLRATEPANGAAWDGGPIVFVFDKPMQSADILVSPMLAGETTVDGERVTFTPSEAPAANTRYVLTIASATAQDGTTLSASVQTTLQATGPLTVAATQPSDGAEESDPNAPIVVIFNRPVVPLVGVDQQGDLPQPLTFDPEVKGSGQWISTSVYQFTPDEPLGGATTYNVTVDALTDVAGDTMAEPYAFAFTTAAPIVLSAQPQGIFIAPSSPVTVTFSQPMDPASTEAAFSLTAGEAETPVAGAASWNITNTVLTFTPAAPLAYGVEHYIKVADTAQPASQQGTLRQAFEGTFTVVPLPAVASTSILDGAEAVNPETELRIRFTAPVSDSTIYDAISITPLLTSTNVVSYTYTDYYENTNQNQTSVGGDIPFGYNTHVMLNWYREPNTTYTVTVGAGVTDPFGNQTTEPTVVSFTTGDYSPLVQIDLDRFTHYSAFTTTVVGVKYRNVDTVDAELFRLPLNDLYLLGGENQYQVWDTYQVPDQAENRIWQKSAPADGPRNVINMLGFTLDDAEGNPLPPGVYMLEVRDPTNRNPNGGDGPAIQRAVIVLTNNNLTIKRGSQGDSLAWLTDLKSGQPVGGAPVTFTRNGTELGSGTTDDSGLVLAPLNLPADQQYVPIFAVSGNPGEDGFAVVSSDWDTGIEPWSYNFSTSGSSDQTVINLYTERPVYRPGQTVFWKGIIRSLQNDEWATPEAGQTFRVKIGDNLGNVIFDREYKTDDWGTINGEFVLAPDAPTGYYNVSTQYEVNGSPQAYGSATFVVAAYRKPEFQIDVSTDKPEYIQGDTIKLNVQANYFSGSPLADAPVEWRLIANTYSFTWKDAPAGRNYSFDPFDPAQADYNPYENAYLGLVQEGKGTTDAKGNFTLELPADLGASLASQQWSLDVTITSPTSQQVFNSVSFPVHRGAYYIGLSPQSYVAEVGQEAPVDVVTVTPDGARYPNAAVDVVVYAFQWNSVYERGEDGNFYWKSTADRTPVYTTTVTTDTEGMATVAFTPDKGGQYQVTALGKDDAGNEIRSAAFVWVADAGSGYVAWPRQNNDRIELVADQKLYQPGDTARVLVPNPFTGPVKALVTVERGGVIDAKVIELTGSSETLQIPIEGSFIPNVYVGVVLVKGLDETNPFVATRVGYAKLSVDTSEKALTVDIQPSATTLKPGDTVTYTLTIRDSAGNPVPDAQTSVALVDKAVLALGAGFGDTRSLLDIFYYERPLGVTTGSLIVINKDRVSAQLAEGGKGGGGGGGDGGPEVREEFPDTAFWRADLVSDENGVIEFAVKLPDNLTTWVLTAKSVTKDTLVGQNTNEIVATKELQVRPGIPRFFTAGDKSTITGVVLNASTDTLTDGAFDIQVSGATLDDPAATQPFTLEAGAFTTFDFPLTVDDTAANVVVTMTATAGSPDGDFNDAVRITVPVVKYQSPETVGTSGVVSPTSVTEAVYVPPTATDDGELRITLDPSLAAGLVDGLAYLEHYPYECTEQTVSRFLPNLFTARALKELGIEDPALAEQLAYQTGIGVQRLVSSQNPDGGWGYWPQEQSSPFITAYVLWGLWNANELGYLVDATVFDRGATYLDSQFVAPDKVTADWQLNEMAFMHFVLAEMGRGDAGRMSTLYDVRERLEAYGQALLAMALHDMNPDDARVQTLMDDLLGSAVITATGAFWQDRSNDFQIMSTNTRSTAIVLEAFLRITPDQPILPNVVRWLMAARADGRWSTTQENAWSIIALTDYMAATGELQANYDWSVTLNDAELGSGTFDDPKAQQELRQAITDLLRDEANTIVIGRSDGPGQLYYSTYLTYNVPARDVEPLDRGMVIERQFFVDGKPVSEVKVGDVVSVTVTIVAPTDLYHVLVEAPIPAGAEPLDPNLPTGMQYDQQGQPILRPVNAAEGGWYNWTPASLDYQDDKVALFATYLPAGTYQYSFEMRAAFPGEYGVIPAHGEMMYFPEVWGRSGGQTFTITR